MVFPHHATRRSTFLLLAAVVAVACGGRTIALDGEGDGGAAGSGAGGGGGAAGSAGYAGVAGYGGVGGYAGVAGYAGAGAFAGTGAYGGVGGASAGEPCGPTWCAAGDRCCDPMYGICAPLDMPCSAPPPLEPCGPYTVCDPGSYCCDPSCGYCEYRSYECAPFVCAPPPMEPCGPVLCPEGTFCCDKCGVCSDYDGSCSSSGSYDPAPAPPPGTGGGSGGVPYEPPLCPWGTPCGPQDAYGNGSCGVFFGYSWQGAGCVGIYGCECVGGDCLSLYPDPDSCYIEHEMCPW